MLLLHRRLTLCGLRNSSLELANTILTSHTFVYFDKVDSIERLALENCLWRRVSTRIEDVIE